MRKLTLLLVFCFAACLAAVAARADSATAAIDQINQQLDRARATLDDAHKNLAEPGLTDAALTQLRNRVDPLRGELQGVIDKLTPRLAAIEERLKELAPAARPAEPPKPAEPAPAPPPDTAKAAAKPAPAPAARPETKQTPGANRPGDPARNQKKTDEGGASTQKPETGTAPEAPPAEQGAAEAAASAELVEQRKTFDALDATLKRARALLLETKQVSVAIVARQRDLFAQSLFLRTDGFFSPTLWRAALADWADVRAAAGDFLYDRAANFSARIDDRRSEFLFLVFGILLLLPPSMLLSRRVLARDNGDGEPTNMRRAAAAAWTAIVAAAAPIIAAFALGLVFRAFDAMDANLEPLWQRCLESVARIASVYAVSRAVFAPTHPKWRLIDPGDTRAKLYVRFFTIAAAVISLTRIIEQVEESVQASVPVVIVTRGLGVMTVALLLAYAIVTLSPQRRAHADDAAPTVEGRDWIALTRATGALALSLMLAACALGYVTFANFVIIQTAWIGGVVFLLYVFVMLAGGGAEVAFSPDNFFGRALVNGFGLKRDQLAPLGVTLSGLLTVTACAVAALLVIAPWGYHSNDFLSRLQSSFFSFTVGDVTISLASLLGAVFVFFLTLAAAQALRRWLDARLLPLLRLDPGFRNAIGATLGYAGFILAATLAMSQLGFGIERLAIVAGALSVGIGFGLQSIVNNFVSGLILLWERAIRVGDWVVIGDEQGYVRRINVRSTEIETFDRATMIVPNSNLVAGVVKNWLRGDRVGRIKIALAPHAGVDPETMRELMIEAARAQEGVLRIPAPQVMFLGMEPASYRFELWCYVEDVEKSARVRSDLHFDLHRRLREAGISIAAPSAPPAPLLLQMTEIEKLTAAAAATALALQTEFAAAAEAASAKVNVAASSEDEPAADGAQTGPTATDITPTRASDS